LLLKAPSFTDAGAVKLFQARLSELGVDLQRVEFRGPTGLADMMQEYHDVDIALDPIPYNGGTTSLQALWMGVPVVVLEGAHFVSRMGASFMTAARLPEWIAEDEDDYVRIAAQMAMDRPKLKELKRGLRARLQALPGWDPARQTRSLEEAFVGMCHQNLKPR
jgi:predicted O-linked N-acetylglucosamine transferase (SPINDLY family)